MKIEKLYESVGYLVDSLDITKLYDNRMRDAIDRELTSFGHCLRNPNLNNDNKLRQYVKTCSTIIQCYDASCRLEHSAL